MNNSDKKKSLETLNAIILHGQKLEAINEKDIQKRDPKANLYIYNIHPTLTAQ